MSCDCRFPQIALFLIALTFAGGTLPAADPKVYALLVFDTHAEDIGDDTKIDRDNLTRVLFKSFDQDGRRHRLEMRVLEGSDANPENVLKYYADIKSTEDDTFFFYYSGHGGTDQDRGHFLAMTHGRLYRSDLRGAIFYQKSRRDVIITDCCANFPGGRDVDPLTVGEEANWEVAKDLFFTGSGLVDLNAAEPGGFSYTNSKVGGYFTAAFTYEICQERSDLDNNDDGRVTWPEFLGNVDGTVERHYIDRDRQYSHAFFLDDWPQHFWERTLRVKNDSSEHIRVHVQYYTKTDEGNWRWFSPEGSWTFTPGESATLSDPPPEDFRVRGKYIRIWAESLDGRWSWTRYKDENFEMVDTRFGYAAPKREIKTFSFSD